MIEHGLRQLLRTDDFQELLLPSWSGITSLLVQAPSCTGASSHTRLASLVHRSNTACTPLPSQLLYLSVRREDRKAVFIVAVFGQG